MLVKAENPRTKLLFAYGILKRGFCLDLVDHGASYVGKAALKGAVLYDVGGGVGMRFSDDPLQVAHGEVFFIPDSLWKWLDSIESNGLNYTREVTAVCVEVSDGEVSLMHGNSLRLLAWVYQHTRGSAEFYDRLPTLEVGYYGEGSGHHHYEFQLRDQNGG